MYPETFQIIKRETHALRECLCADCSAERSRLDSLQSNRPGCVCLSPMNAYHLGIIGRSKLTACGSLVRQLLQPMDD